MTAEQQTHGDERELDRLLGLIAKVIDLERCQEVDRRYRMALAFEDVDRPPLVVEIPFNTVMTLPPPWDSFRRYSYRQAFSSPTAMLQNQLLNRVVPGLLLGDDSPLSIRNDHGTIQVASVLGGNWRLLGDDYPWVEHFERIQDVEKAAEMVGGSSLHKRVLSQSLATLQFYRNKLEQFPPCSQAIQISLPDLEGPLNTAEQLWGSQIYLAFHDRPELLDRLLSRVVDATLLLAGRFREYSTDRLDPVANTQHGYVIPGRLLVREDAAIMISQDTYADVVRPHDARLLREVGAGSIHFCGNGQQLIASMLQIPGLRGLDFGDSHLMDLASIHAACGARKVAITNVNPSRDDLVTGAARRRFPTGVVFVYPSADFGDAKDVVRCYKLN